KGEGTGAERLAARFDRELERLLDADDRVLLHAGEALRRLLGGQLLLLGKILGAGVQENPPPAVSFRGTGTHRGAAAERECVGGEPEGAARLKPIRLQPDRYPITGGGSPLLARGFISLAHLFYHGGVGGGDGPDGGKRAWLASLERLLGLHGQPLLAWLGI